MDAPILDHRSPKEELYVSLFITASLAQPFAVPSLKAGQADLAVIGIVSIPVIVLGTHLGHGMMHADVGTDGAGVPVRLGIDCVRPMLASTAIGSMHR